MRRVTGAKAELLRRLAAMPFLDRLEMAALSGWSQSAVYEAVRKLEDAGLIASVPHGTELVPPTRRFHLSAAGLRRLAQDENAALDDLLRDRPVSARWRRVLLERLDALAVIYRLAADVSNLAYPVRFRWYRAMPLDAALTLRGGRTVGIVRQGLTSDRTDFSKRLWRLTQGPRPGAVLLLMPDEARLRHARRLLAQSPVAALFALESEAVAATPDDPVWRLRSVNASVGLRAAIHRLPPGGSIPAEQPLARTSMPEDIDENGTGRGVPEHMLPALLNPAEKRVLDLLSDWPWLTLDDLAGLLGVTYQRASKLTSALEGFGLIVRIPAAPRRMALTNLGLAVLARRDRSSVGGARKRWSAAPTDAGDWRNVSGRRSRQLLRDMQHTAAVHAFIAALATQARDTGWGDRPARPAHPRLALLPAPGRDALHPPRRLRHPPAGRRSLALLSGVGAQGRPPRDDGRPARPLPALLLLAPAHRRPRREARRPGGLPRRHRRHPLPARGGRGDGSHEDPPSPAGLPPRTPGAGGAAGTGMARPRRRL